MIMKNNVMFKVKLLIFGGQLEQKQVTAFPKQSFLMTLIKTVCWATTYIFLAQKLFIVSYYIRSLRVRISNVHLFFSCFVNVGKKSHFTQLHFLFLKWLMLKN